MAKLSKVLMLKTQRGAANGIDIVEYKAGRTYDLPAIFYDRWIERGLCEPFVEKEQVKMLVTNIQNKMIQPVKENKLDKLRDMKIVGVSNKKLAEELNITIEELKELKKQLKA